MASILKVDTIQDQSGNNIINESSDTITIGASGDTITVPTGASMTGQNYPAWKVTQNTAQTWADGTVAKVDFDTEVFDTDNAYDTTNKRFVVPTNRAGKYFSYAQIFCAGADGERFTIQMRVNGSTVNETLITGQSADGGSSYVATTILDLSESDYLEIYFRNDTGTSQTNNNSASLTYFMGYRIGA